MGIEVVKKPVDVVADTSVKPVFGLVGSQLTATIGPGLCEGPALFVLFCCSTMDHAGFSCDVESGLVPGKIDSTDPPAYVRDSLTWFAEGHLGLE